MNIRIDKINPDFIEVEGFYYLEFEGEFYKGCRRCGGTGHYAHNGEHDRCYYCDDTSAKLGEQLPSREAAEKWCHGRAVARDRRIRKAEEKRLEAVRAMEANQAALKASDPDVYEFLMGIVIEDDTQHQFATYEEWAISLETAAPVKYEKDGFLRAMAETLRWVAPSKPFTEKMISVVRSKMERRAQQAAQDAAADPVPEGRQTVTGVILSAKIKESDFGTAYKIVVKDDRGFRIYVSLPKAQADELHEQFWDARDKAGHPAQDFGPACWFLGVEGDDLFWSGAKGRRITFTATLEKSQDDKAFGFGSRPSKGAWL